MTNIRDKPYDHDLNFYLPGGGDMIKPPPGLAAAWKMGWGAMSKYHLFDIPALGDRLEDEDLVARDASSLGRYRKIKELNELVMYPGRKAAEKLSIEDLTRDPKFGDGLVKWASSDDGISRAAANYIYDIKIRETDNAYKVQQLEGFLPNTVNIVGGLANMMIADPANLIMAPISAIPGLGTAPAAFMLAQKAEGLRRLLRPLWAQKTLNRARVWTGFKAGIGYNTAFEIPVAAQMYNEHSEYTLADSLLNITAGGLFGGALVGIGGRGVDWVKGLPYKRHNAAIQAVSGLDFTGQGYDVNTVLRAARAVGKDVPKGKVRGYTEDTIHKDTAVEKYTIKTPIEDITQERVMEKYVEFGGEDPGHYLRKKPLLLEDLRDEGPSVGNVRSDGGHSPDKMVDNSIEADVYFADEYNVEVNTDQRGATKPTFGNQPVIINQKSGEASIRTPWEKPGQKPQEYYAAKVLELIGAGPGLTLLKKNGVAIGHMFEAPYGKQLTFDELKKMAVAGDKNLREFNINLVAQQWLFGEEITGFTLGFKEFTHQYVLQSESGKIHYNPKQLTFKNLDKPLLKRFVDLLTDENMKPLLDAMQVGDFKKALLKIAKISDAKIKALSDEKLPPKYLDFIIKRRAEFAKITNWLLESGVNIEELPNKIRIYIQKLIPLRDDVGISPNPEVRKLAYEQKKEALKDEDKFLEIGGAENNPLFDEAPLDDILNIKRLFKLAGQSRDKNERIAEAVRAGSETNNSRRLDLRTEADTAKYLRNSYDSQNMGARGKGTVITNDMQSAIEYTIVNWNKQAAKFGSGEDIRSRDRSADYQPRSKEELGYAEHQLVKEAQKVAEKYNKGGFDIDMKFHIVLEKRMYGKDFRQAVGDEQAPIAPKSPTKETEVEWEVQDFLKATWAHPKEIKNYKSGLEHLEFSDNLNVIEIYVPAETNVLMGMYNYNFPAVWRNRRKAKVTQPFIKEHGQDRGKWPAKDYAPDQTQNYLYLKDTHILLPPGTRIRIKGNRGEVIAKAQQEMIDNPMTPKKQHEAMKIAARRMEMGASESYKMSPMETRLKANMELQSKEATLKKGKIERTDAEGQELAQLDSENLKAIKSMVESMDPAIKKSGERFLEINKQNKSKLAELKHVFENFVNCISGRLK